MSSNNAIFWRITMFAKTTLSVLAFGIVLIGLLQYFNSGEYLVFVSGMVLYFMVAISDTICKLMNK
jgi:hypothetical protein